MVGHELGDDAPEVGHADLARSDSYGSGGKNAAARRHTTEQQRETPSINSPVHECHHLC